MIAVSVLTFICLLLCSASFTSALEDKHKSCEIWASKNECEKNPNYMLPNCALSCSKVSKSASAAYSSFYDIKETDILGKELSFESFRGNVVYIVNVASYCGYTAKNYETFRKLAEFKGMGLEIVVAPCNQFGSQEPGDSVAIAKFAAEQQFDGIILSKGDVNGQNTRPSFSFLKHTAGKANIGWNFDGKFIVDREGNVHIPGNDVIADIKHYLEGKDL